MIGPSGAVVEQGRRRRRSATTIDVEGVEHVLRQLGDGAACVGEAGEARDERKARRHARRPPARARTGHQDRACLHATRRGLHAARAARHRPRRTASSADAPALDTMPMPILVPQLVRLPRSISTPTSSSSVVRRREADAPTLAGRRARSRSARGSPCRRSAPAGRGELTRLPAGAIAVPRVGTSSPSSGSARHRGRDASRRGGVAARQLAGRPTSRSRCPSPATTRRWPCSRAPPSARTPSPLPPRDARHARRPGPAADGGRSAPDDDAIERSRDRWPHRGALVRDLVNTPPIDLHPARSPTRRRAVAGTGSITGARRGGARGRRLRRHPRRRAGLGRGRRGSSRLATRPRARQAPRARRQGHHLRLRRAVAEARRHHGRA